MDGQSAARAYPQPPQVHLTPLGGAGASGGRNPHSATPPAPGPSPAQVPSQSLTPAPPTPGPAKPVRRRNRMIHSCLPCRQRKIRCSKATPSCINCVKADRECLYIGPRLDEAGQLRLAEIKEKQGTLERQLERDVARPSLSSPLALTPLPATSPWPDWRGPRADGGGGAGEGTGMGRRQESGRRRSEGGAGIVADEVGDGCVDEERDLECTPLVALDLTYDDDTDDVGDTMDLGVRIGKMRITERIGGLSRPRISEEVRLVYSSKSIAGTCFIFYFGHFLPFSSPLFYP